MVLGSIMSPGNSPFAITVGSLNTWSTVYRGDDTLATYSSRGPARYDVAVKPDVAAPGNKIVSLEASGAYLPAHYGYLHRFGYGDNAYMMLSGTSMATPMVSGGVALLLQGSPGLTPSQVKLALQAGATYMPDAGLMGAGAGSVNFLASRQIAQNGLSALPTTLVGGLTGRVSGAAFWDAGTLSDRLYAGVGTRLLSLLEAPLVWLNPSLLRFGDLNLVGLVNPLALVPPNRLLYGEVATWTHEQQILWGTQIVDPRGQQILWGTSADEEQILWGTSTGANDPMTAQDPQ
jgi:subtilisin family serine protease